MGKLELFLYLVTLLSSLFISSCTSQYNLVPGASITANQTLTSSIGTFSLGFFSPKNSTKHYLGIWYNRAPNREIIWVANRQSPLDSPGFFKLGDDGNLVVLGEDHKALIWSSNVSLSASVNNNGTTGVLMDTGNLVLRFGEENIWESFDHPTDTVVSSMKISMNKRTGKKRSLTSWAAHNDPQPGKFTLGLDPTGRSQAFIWKGSNPYVRAIFLAVKETVSEFPVPSTYGAALSLTYNFDTDEPYITFGVSDSSEILLMARLYPNGVFEHRLWLELNKTWFSYGKAPVDCGFYAHCGRNGACQKRENHLSPTCRCLTGFKPRFPKQWDMRDWTGGCVREEPLTCDNPTEWYFPKFERLKLPDHFVLEDNKSLNECESKCRQNCSCTAYALQNSTEGSTIGKCLTWFGDLLDIVHVENGTLSPGLDLYVRVHNSEQGVKDNSMKRSLLIPTVSTAIGMTIIIVGYFSWKKTWGKVKFKDIIQSGSARVGKSDIELPLFSLKSILAATNNFSEADKLGEGGYGPVYKGILPVNEAVAIKRLSKNSGQGHHEFMNELKLIAKLQHNNLVRLLGCCVEDDEMILIYEYMPNRSLDKFLFDPSENRKLDWGRRFQIIEGIAQGVLYLHKYSRLKIIHRDLKASNVLLDGTMNPKISDFGMAKIFGMNQTEANTNRVVGTYGYMSPEYASYGHFSEKSDVFSFGVLLLEIVSGKRNSSFYRFEHSITLARWVWELCKESRGMEVVDASVRELCPIHQALRCINVGLLCVQQDPADRPTMSLVIHMLQGNEASSSLPLSKQPAFSTITTPSFAGSSSTIFTNNEVTNTLPEAR